MDTILPQVLSFTQKLVSYPCAEMGQQRQRAAQMFGKERPSTKPSTSTTNEVRCQSRVSGSLVPGRGAGWHHTSAEAAAATPRKTTQPCSPPAGAQGLQSMPGYRKLKIDGSERSFHHSVR